jgi:hypothetical protein
VAVDLAPAIKAMEDLMVDACVIFERDESTQALNEATGENSGATEIEHYSGKCLLGVRGQSSGAWANQGGQDLRRDAYRASVPLSVTTIEKGYLLRITASRDPHLVGEVYRITSVLGSTMAVARRMFLEHES